ncbi:hypothetical protein [Pseudomonas oryzihabitans]|uniref:hypothetical protein n=1 Tax=Pseudomonas oryzihabitans TaxID=47885 RepID=UPI0028947BE3|nr:hypothetical protein [Pseudomonas oryzihabitans]MDT3722898.1 hypothetical protein [Pseudomonas oryzihabitans]
MRDITHRIKIYKEGCKSHFHRMADSTVFRLLTTQILLSVFALTLYFLDLWWWWSNTYDSLPFWVLITEIALIPGLIQLTVLRELAKDRDLFPDTPTRSLRIALKRSKHLKFRAMATAFSAPRDPLSLAEEVRNKWQSRRSLTRDIRSAKGNQISSFFRLPSPSVSNAYVLGITGVVFTLIVALLQREEVIASLPLSWEIFQAFLIMSVVPALALAISVPVVWNGFLASGLSIREKLDDDYLSARSVFTFIEDLLELHDTGTPRLLLKTSGRVYWLIRILTTPMSRLGTVIRQARKSGRIGKLRRKQRYADL